MDFNDLIKVVLASPPGTIVHADHDSKDVPLAEQDWKIKLINGQKPEEA